MGIYNLIEYDFTRHELLEEALSHSSFGAAVTYQRLEFLGDRILSLAVAEALYDLFPDDNESKLTLRLIELVRKESVASVASGLGLQEYIRVGPEQKVNESILSDVMEAIIGAVCIDSDCATGVMFARSHWMPYISRSAQVNKDHKSTLQEWSQQKFGVLPIYNILEVAGPAHEPIFTAEVRVSDKKQIGTGPSKKSAQTEAARLYLELYVGGV